MDKNELAAPIVIGITGKAQAGKDTVALIIANIITEYNNLPDIAHEDSYVVGAEAFAGPIKSMIAMLLDFFGVGQITNPDSLRPYIDGELKETVIPEIGKSPRTLMQTLGTEWGRNSVRKSIWQDSMAKRIDMYKEAPAHGYKGAYVLVTDVRFDDEAKRLIKERDAVIIQVVRNAVPDMVGEDDHPSEAGLSPSNIARTITNDGDLEALEATVRKELADILPAHPAMAALGDQVNDEERSEASA